MNKPIIFGTYKAFDEWITAKLDTLGDQAASELIESTPIGIINDKIVSLDATIPGVTQEEAITLFTDIYRDILKIYGINIEDYPIIDHYEGMQEDVGYRCGCEPAGFIEDDFNSGWYIFLVIRRKLNSMRRGNAYYTPRFGYVVIEEVFDSRAKAEEAGYTEPTHWLDAEYSILGKSLDLYHMNFAAYKL